jgi:nucleotide exchange factor SIL1
VINVSCIFLDQAIPAGLRVRLNLETGKKEAKLMDGDDGHKYWKSGDKQGSVTRSNSGLSRRERLSEQISPKYDI